MIIVQLILYCLLFTAMVRFAVRGGAVDRLYLGNGYGGVNCVDFLSWLWKGQLCSHDIFRKEKWRV